MVATASGDDALDCVDVAGVIELTWNAEEIGEIKVPQPQHVQSGHRRDVVQIVQAARGLDHRDDQRARVGDADLLGDITARVVVVREAERCAASPMRRILRAGDQLLGLRARFHHRHHHAHRADIERPRDEMIVPERHTNERHDRQAATQRELRFQGFEIEPGVFHAVHRELGTGIDQELRQARRHELEHHRTEGALPRSELVFERVGSHGERELRVRSGAGRSAQETAPILTFPRGRGKE